MTPVHQVEVIQRVEVSAADIEAGTRRDPRNCAVAVAIRRQLGLGAVVTGASVELETGRRFGASLALADWLWDFDELRTVQPIVVELRRAEGMAVIQGEVPRALGIEPWRK